MITAVHYHGAHPHAASSVVSRHGNGTRAINTRGNVFCYRHGRRVFFFPPHLWRQRACTPVCKRLRNVRRTTAFDVSISTHVPLLGNFFSFFFFFHFSGIWGQPESKVAIRTKDSSHFGRRRWLLNCQKCVFFFFFYEYTLFLEYFYFPSIYSH